ncbi:MAG: cytochrome P450 [Burkholderiales bacterium]
MSNAQAVMADTLMLPADVAGAIVDPKVHADLDRLHAAYSWARAHNPLGIAQVEGFDPFWVVTKHADIMEVGRDAETYHNSDRSSVVFPKATIDQFVAMTGKPNVSDTLIALDGDQHRKLRGITQKWFMPASVRQLDGRVREIAKTFVDKMQGLGGECDFVGDVGLLYPLRVVMDIMGVPPQDEPLMLKLTQEIFAPQDPEMNRAQAEADPVEMAKQMGAIIADFARYFGAITTDRLKNPRNDLATVLATAQIDGVPLNEGVLSSYYLIVATAGHDTTSSSTATAMWALANFPDLLPRLKDDLSLIPGFIDEAIRWGTPVRHFMRTATKDVELRGRKIAKGDWLMLCYGSGNRDEEVFEAPFEFRIDRKPNKHLAFGYGAHVCLGQHLGKMEMQTLFEELIPRLASVELAGPMSLSAANLVSGPKRLPLRYRFA